MRILLPLMIVIMAFLAIPSHATTLKELVLIQQINKDVNESIIYQTDKDQYGVEDKWVIDPPSHKGDCEDYAITKLERLRKNNIRIPRIQLRMVLDETYGSHAVAIVDNYWVLDNRYPNVMTVPQLIRIGYYGLPGQPLSRIKRSR